MKTLTLALLLISSTCLAGDLTYTTAEVQEQLTGVYAEIYVNSNATIQVVATGGGYTQVTNFSANGDSSQCTADFANNKITLTKNGEYRLASHISFTGSGNGNTWFGTIFADGSELSDIHFERKIGTGGDHGAAGVAGFYSCTNAPIDIDLRMRHDDVGNLNLTATYLNINAHRIGL
jgi:hypothetical protein